jgi:uncharacterized protein YjbJ (UPF0337 family)
VLRRSEFKNVADGVGEVSDESSQNAKGFAKNQDSEEEYRLKASSEAVEKWID